MSSGLMAAVVALVGLAGPALAEGAAGAAGVVTVSCYRGPTDQVIWDQPNLAFTDSLRAVGYDVGTAQAIAERVCRDPALLHDDEAMRAMVLDLMAGAPRRQG